MATAVKAVAKKLVAKVSSIPKTLAACADLLYKTKKKRLTLNRDVDTYQKLEAQLKKHLINELPVGEASGITGLVASVQIDTKAVGTVTDWDALYCYILFGKDGWKEALKKHKKASNPTIARFALLNRALNQSTVKEMWDGGEAIPGVDRFNQKIVSVTKRKVRK